MKEIKEKLLKKLNFIPTTITTLKQGLILHQFHSPQNLPKLLLYKDEETESGIHHQGNQNHTITNLAEFEEKCPPGGEDAVVFYTTSLRGIRKTFEDCRKIKFLLSSFKVVVQERDVSMHMEFRKELWSIMGTKAIPPKVFIKGMYIGGAEEVVILNEQGKLKKLLEGIPVVMSSSRCNACGGMLFVVCSGCNGSRKVYKGEEGGEELWIRCHECNENGLVRCTLCS